MTDLGEWLRRGYPGWVSFTAVSRGSPLFLVRQWCTSRRRSYSSSVSEAGRMAASSSESSSL